MRLAHLEMSKKMRYGLYLKASESRLVLHDIDNHVREVDVHSQILISAANLPLRVGGVDQFLGITVLKAVDGDGRPTTDEDQEEEEAEHVGARAALDGAAELGVVVALLAVLVLVAPVEVLDAVAAPHDGDGISTTAYEG